MNAAELISWVRAEATVSANSTEYTDAVILDLLNGQLSTIFEPLIADCRAGYWYHTVTRQLGSGNPFVRLPPRACAFEQVDISIDGGRCWEPLSEALEQEAQEWDRPNYSVPQAYVIRGSSLVLLPATTRSDVLLRAKIIIRPSELVMSQAGGVVTAVDLDTRQLTLTTLPIDRDTGVPISGTVICDAIEPRNCYELSLFDASCTVNDATHVTVEAGPSMLKVEVGDVLRVAGQTDWPQIMHSFHKLLGSTAAVLVCRQRDLNERADMLQSSANTMLSRYDSFLKPRVRIGAHTPIAHSWEP